jgi:hypothetical protein
VTRSNANTAVQSGHKKETCWKIEANQSKRPEWWIDTVAVIADDGMVIL